MGPSPPPAMPSGAAYQARAAHNAQHTPHVHHTTTLLTKHTHTNLQYAVWRAPACLRGWSRAGGLTLTHLRGSSDYRSCQHLAQRSVLTQLNGSPKTSVNTAVNTVLIHPPGKNRVYLQKTGYTREIPGSASMPRAPYSQGHCANCSAHRLLKYAHRTMCARYKCQNAKGSIGARHGLQAAVRTTRSCQHSATRSRRCSACACATPIN